MVHFSPDHLNHIFPTIPNLSKTTLYDYNNRRLGLYISKSKHDGCKCNPPRKMKHSCRLLLLTILTAILIHHHHHQLSAAAAAAKPPENETIYKISKQLCWNCVGEAIQFLYGHNLVRARKMELPLAWDSGLADYARWWGGQRRGDCRLQHSFPEGGFELGENIYWGSGQQWTAMDAVSAWADEEKYYDYRSNSCAEGEMCGHYTQIVWRNTRKLGCARVVCDTGDVFITCNYFPPGNYVGERPY